MSKEKKSDRYTIGTVTGKQNRHPNTGIVIGMGEGKEFKGQMKPSYRKMALLNPRITPDGVYEPYITSELHPWFYKWERYKKANGLWDAKWDLMDEMNNFKEWYNKQDGIKHKAGYVEGRHK